MKATYNMEPEAVLYMPLPSGKADVWLRKNIEQTTDEENNPIWQADEVYFRTELAREAIETDFEMLYENGGEETAPDEPEKEDLTFDELERVIMEAINND